MDNNDKIKYWLELAEYDLETARLIIEIPSICLNH